MIYTLVFPRDAHFDEGKISVLAPIGTAILGYRSGDVIEWKVPGGLRKLQVEEILDQPEAADRAARAEAALDSRHADIGVCSRFAGRPRPHRARLRGNTKKTERSLPSGISAL